MSESEHEWYKTADERVDEIFSDLLDAGHGLPSEVRRIAKTLADVVGHETTEWAANRPPKVIASGCIYIADTIVRGEDRMTQRELGRVSPVTAASIREHYHDIPAVFLENATEREFDQLTDETIAKLRMYRAAEHAGIGLANVDPDEYDPDALRDLAYTITEVRTFSE